MLLAALFLPSHLVSQDTKTAKPDSSSVAELVGRALANYKIREAQLENYTYLASVVRTEFDRHGKPTGEITGTDEIMMLEGAQYRRTILLNGRPLSPEQEKEQQIMLEAEAAARRAGHNQHPVRLSSFVPIVQFPDEFRLRWRGQGSLDGSHVQVIDALPFEADERDSADHEYARHFRMKLWIDADEAQIVRVESEVIRTLTLDQDLLGFRDQKFSGVGAWRFEYARGTKTVMEWTKVNGETWLPKWSSWKAPKETVTDLAPARTAGPLKFRDQRTQTFSNYKKFRVDSRVVPK